MPDKIYALNIPPGIQKDGTQFASKCWTDGQWTRFQRGLPRKIGGYQEIASTNEIIRGIYVVPNPPNFNVFYGTSDNLYSLPINSTGNTLGAPVDITPVSFQGNPYNDWTFNTLYSATTQSSVLIAHAAPNLFSIANNIDRTIFYSQTNINDGLPLIPNGFSVSGGIVVLHPYLFAFGNNGQVTWFVPNSPTEISGQAIVSGDKIVAGIPSRGGTNSPAGLLWTLTDLIRVTYTGNPADQFNFDAVSSESSILSSRGIIEYDNQYYWLGVDRFLVYNGTVQELPNDKNINFFFDNLNSTQRQKVWATKITRYGEIWWIYPSGNSSECNAAIIYNVRERCWYNTFFDIAELDGRSDGYFDQTFAKPIWGGTITDNVGNYPLYVQETGKDLVELDGTTSAITTYIKSSGLSFCATAPDNSRSETDINLYISRIEPDFILTGSMTVNIYSNEYANSPQVLSETSVFTNTTTKMDFTVMGREIYIQFYSSDVGFDYQMGQVLIVGKLGDIRA